MTGIFQIFDRYKAKALVKNERRKIDSGEPEIKTIPPDYVAEHDGRKRVPDSSDRRSSEASRDSRRSSSADVSEVVVKTLTPLFKESPTIQNPLSSGRPSVDSPKLSLSLYKSSFSLEAPNEFRDSFQNPEIYSSDAATPKPTGPSRGSVDTNRSKRDGRRLPPRSASKSKERSLITLLDYLKDVPDDAREISRAILQIRESANKSSYGEARRQAPSALRKEFHSSGDEQDSKYSRHDRSSGDERVGHRHPTAREARRYSSATEQHVYDYELDHHRPQFPVEGKDFLQGRRNQSSSHHHVREMARYMSSGDEMDRRSNMSSGDDRGAYRLHRSHDQESSRSHWPVDKDGHRYHSAGDVFEDSSGDERVQRPYPRRHQHQGHQKYHASKEGRRRVIYDALGRELLSSGDEMPGHRHVPRRHPSIHYAGYRHGAEANIHQRYQTASEDYRLQTSSASKASRPSTSGFEGRRYQSSGDERSGHRRVDGRRRHDPPLDNNWRNESSDEDREVFLQQQQHRRSSIDPRRSSSATDAQRRHSVSNDEGQRYSASHDDRRRDRSRSSVRNGSKYEPVVESRCDSQNFHSRGGWGFEEANVSGALKESHRRNMSVESKGEHRRRSSNSSVTSNKESLKLHSKPKVKGVYSRDLPPRSSSGSRNNTVSPRNVVDMRDLARLNMQVRESSQTSALGDVYRAEKSSDLCAESVPGSYDFREMMRAVDFKDAQWNSEKVSARNSFDGRDPPRTSNVSRVSVDSRQYQSSTPRLSVDGREHLRASSLHSSRASSVDARVQMRTNSMDSSSTSGEFKRRGPSVVARLMGLAELPEKGDASQAREVKSLQRLLSSTPPAEASSPPAKTQHHLSEVAQQMKQVQARLHQDSQLYRKTETRPKLKSKTKSRTQSKSRSPPPAPASQQDKDTPGSLNQHQGYGSFGRQVEPGSPLPRQSMSPKHHQMEGMPKKRPQDFASGDLDQRLHQLRIKNSIQEHRTLKQILEAMHLKGLLHPPPKKPSKSPGAEVNESKEEAERPLQDFESKPSARVNRSEYEGQLNFEDLIRMDSEVHKESAIDKDQSGEASIVVMKPLNYQSAIPPAATKEVDMNSESASRSGFSREKIEIGHRRRGSERRAGSSGKLSRSHSLDLPVQTSANKVLVDDLSFANVMLSWRERIAADAVKKATVDVAELKTQSRAKSTALRHRSQDASPSTRSSGSTEKRVGSSRIQEIPVEDYTREEYDTASRNVLSDTAQENAYEDRLRVVDRSKSDLQLSAKTVEAMAALDASSHDRVPAQVAVLRTKRASGKSSRSKDKLRASYPADPRSNSPSIPSRSTPESSTDQRVQSPSHSLNDSKTMSLGPDANAQEEYSSKAADDSSRMTPKKRKITEPGDQANSPPKVTLEVGVHRGVPNEVEDSTRVGELAPLQCTLVASCEAKELQDAKMDDAFDNTPEARTPEGFSSGKCFSDEGTFSLQGADHRSPVSVLDSPIFQEGFHLEELSTSPDSVKSILHRHEDAKDSPELDGAVSCEHESEVLTPHARPIKDTSDPLRDIYTKVVRSLELGEKEIYCRQSSIDLPIPFPSVATETAAGDHSQGKLYVQGILAESGLSDAASILPEDATEVMDFDVFTRKEEELQTAELERIDRGELEKTEEKRYKESLDRRLIFDCMNEILERSMSPFLNPQPWGAPVVRRKPHGQRLLNEVWDELRDMHWPTSVSDDALYAVLQKDFMRKGFQWLDFSVEVGEVGCELECMILQELVEEIVQEVKNIEPKSAVEPQPVSPASSSPRAEDASELRRRELLDKTRRDLLAWHVQYQQL